MSNEFALRQYTLPLPQPFETSKSLQDFGTPKPELTMTKAGLFFTS
ncbi:MAG: hypothetical protein ACLU0O_12430 [Collinsella sp.]